jgi:hypothetical protein
LWGIVNGRCECGTNCGSPGKHPRVPWVTSATTDPDTIEGWWKQWPNANIGVATGKRSGIYVIDIDNKASVELAPGVLVAEGDHSLRQKENEIGRLSETKTVITGSGGTHLIYQYPENTTEPIANRSGLLPSVDTRGDGGYIVAAPSLHISGNRYRWIEESSPTAKMPAGWLTFVSTAPSNVGKGTELEFPDGFHISAGEGRHDWLFKVGAKLRGQHGLPAVALYGALAAYNKSVCVPPISHGELEHIVESCMKYEPEMVWTVDTSDAPAIEEGADLATLLYDFMMEEPPAFVPMVNGLLNSGECMIFGGPPNVGKTWALMDMMVAIAAGEKFLGRFDTQRQPVLFIDEEGSRRGDWERFNLLLAGRDLSSVGLPLYTKIDSGIRLDSDQGLATLSRLIERYKPGAVFLDSLVRVHGASESDNRQMATFFARVKTLMNTYGASFIFTHHVRKPGKDAEEDPIWMLRGASDIQGFPDGVLIALPTKNHDETKVIHTKMRNGPKLDSFIMRRVIDEDSAKLGVLRSEEEASADRQKIIQAIVESPRGFVTAEELASATGLPLSVVVQEAGTMSTAGVLNSHKRGGGWLYQIPLETD